MFEHYCGNNITVYSRSLELLSEAEQLVVTANKTYHRNTTNIASICSILVVVVLVLFNNGIDRFVDAKVAFSYALSIW